MKWNEMLERADERLLTRNFNRFMGIGGSFSIDAVDVELPRFDAGASH